MGHTNVEDVVATVMSAALGRSVSVGEFVSRENEDAWDSLKHMEIIFAVEAALGVEFTEDDIAAIRDTAGLKAKAEQHSEA